MGPSTNKDDMVRVLSSQLAAFNVSTRTYVGRERKKIVIHSGVGRTAKSKAQQKRQRSKIRKFCTIPSKEAEEKHEKSANKCETIDQETCKNYK
ncbi:CLUMA_CG011441, isoform A [Clunio marinus]|uniref:CLUMA_CG011441, isoform A n=1 Tax=Clunio marinus TaxID=568069 RepID=A0A1J1ICV9_9DIPT|nr:CLUMA_CG011441, isoform A [Clunio marinus]